MFSNKVKQLGRYKTVSLTDTDNDVGFLCETFNFVVVCGSKILSALQTG